jgi:ornithine decarboxylase
MELNKISQCAPGSKVYLRLKVSDYGSVFPLSKKFGADETHAVALFGHATDLGLKPIGITFHVGSQSENPVTWENAIERTGVVIKLLKAAGFEIEMLDIGGGFPSKYVDETINFSTLAKTINNALSKHIPKNISLIAEPGRYIVADAAVMLTTVIGRLNRSGQNWLYLDVGVFQGLMESLEMDNWKYPIFTLGDPTPAMPHHFVITGPTCDAQDTIDIAVPLPADIDIGDKVCIGSTGAYTIVYGSNFNGFKTPKVICIN